MNIKVSSVLIFYWPGCLGIRWPIDIIPARRIIPVKKPENKTNPSNVIQVTVKIDQNEPALESPKLPDFSGLPVNGESLVEALKRITFSLQLEENRHSSYRLRIQQESDNLVRIGDGFFTVYEKTQAMKAIALRDLIIHALYFKGQDSRKRCIAVLRPPNKNEDYEYAEGPQFLVEREELVIKVPELAVV